MNCSATPSQANLGGPAPYWYDWTIDRLGNRTKQVQHTASGDLTRDYQVPTAGQDVLRPHAVTATTTTQPGQSTGTTVSYGYDNAGNMITRPGTTGGQVLTWDPEGHLAKVVEGTSTTTNLYDARGNRLIRRDAGGTTLYLPGQEVRRTVSGGTATIDVTRYHSFNGNTIASRTTGAVADLTWLFGDHQGTQQLAVNASTQQVTVRRQNPYGEPRGGNPAWPTSKGFVGGDNDPTGLTHLGAREYDPPLGRFISADPVQDLTDPQQWNSYSYANNSPTTLSDPTGLRPDDLYYGPTAAARIGNALAGASAADSAGSTSNGGGDGGGGGSGRGKGHLNIIERAADFQWRVHKTAFLDLTGMITGSLRLQNAGYDCALSLDASSTSCNYIKGYLGDSAKFAYDAGTCGIFNPDACGRTADRFECGHGISAECVGHATAIILDIAISKGAGTALEAMTAESLAVRATARIADDAAEAKPPRTTGCLTNSFAPATPVLMADGTTKPISDVHVGDQLLATDPDTGKTTARAVTALIINTDTDLLDLTVEPTTGDTATVHTTPQHPFWSPSRHQWVNATDLRPGDKLAASTPLAPLTVGKIRRLTGHQQMYNLTIADIHTYCVLAGTTPVLVHNDGCGRSVAKYEDITDPNSRIANRLTDVGHEEFGDTLISNGWSRSVSKDGNVQIFQKDGAKYALRGNAKTYDGWTAEFTPADSKKATLKIRLGG